MILAVEDNASDLILLRLALEHYAPPERFQSVTDGEQAMRLLSQLAAAGSLPDTVVLDLHLPRVDGYTVLTQIRSNSLFNSVAVLVYTSSDSDVDRKLALDRGADAYFSKPCDLAAYRRLPGAIEEARQHRSERLSANSRRGGRTQN